jgi:uncharacterized protein YbbC (DUF1343 family)
MQGWTRGAWFDDTGLPWVLPSPNLPTLDSARVYPGTVLFEGVSISEGRGTTRPFELVGAPGVDPERFAEGLNRRGLPGVHFRPALFEPTFHKHAHTACGGCQIHVTDRGRFAPVRTGVTLLEAFRREPQSGFAWREPPYEYEYERPPIDILAGSDALRTAIDAGTDAAAIADSWGDAVSAFMRVRERFLLYE